MGKYISDRVQRIDASGVRRVFALGTSLENPVNFSIGQPDFDVPEPVKEAAIEAIRGGQNRYSQTAGDGLLRKKIAERVGCEFGWKDARALVSSGVSGGLTLAFMSLINSGDEVIMADPYFVAYKHLTNMFSGKCVFVDSYPDFDLPVEAMAERISERTKLIIVNSPCNPSGVVYSADRLKALAEVAAEREIIVLSDEIYSKFCYDSDFSSIAGFYDRTLLVRGFSKSHGMPGWRQGYVAADTCLGDVIEEMAKVQQYTFVCAPTPFQKAVIAAMDYDVSDVVGRYRRKRDLVYEGLKDKFELSRPCGAFYAFVKAPGGSGTEFVERAIKKNVLIIPGNVFSEQDTHFRISYATSDEKILEGIAILNDMA